MIEGIRHTGIVVSDLHKVSKFYVSLGFEIISNANEKGHFIEQVTGLQNVDISWIKMKLPDNNILELIKYDFPKGVKKKHKQLANQYGVSHIAFKVKDIDLFCENLVNLGGSIINNPALTSNKRFKVAYCHDVEGNLFEAVEVK